MAGREQGAEEPQYMTFAKERREGIGSAQKSAGRKKKKEPLLP